MTVEIDEELREFYKQEDDRVLTLVVAGVMLVIIIFSTMVFFAMKIRGVI